MAIMWDSVQQATTSDKEMAQLVSIIDSGFFQICQDLQPSLQECYQFWKHICMANGLILFKDHIGITPSLRTDTKKLLYSGKLYPLKSHGTVTT